MRTLLAMVGCLVAACGADDESSIVIELSSDVRQLDAAQVSVFDGSGAIILGTTLTDGSTLELPRRVRIAGGQREAQVRVLVWGDNAGQHVAFGHAMATLEIGVEDMVAIRLDTPPGDCDGDDVPDLLDGCPAIADPMQRDTNADGTTDACVPGAVCEGNRVANAGFESDTTGWRASTANPTMLTRIAGGHAGEFAAEVCKSATGSPGEYLIDDNPNAVPTPLTGLSYRVDAWVRAAAPAGQQIDLRVGEMAVPGNNPIDSVNLGVPATTEWQLVTATYMAAAPQGTATLDVRVRVLDASDGSCFQVDDICVQQLAADCAP